MDAARAGKDVAVLLEGRARFDELQNLHWSLLFRAAGIRILPLPLGYKVHAKALYVRRAGRGYVHLCTGNYNPMNGRLYTDLSLFSSNPELASDAREFFDALEGGAPPQLARMRYGVAGRDTMLERIRGEAGPGGHVILKMNHLTDPAIFQALGEAADAGARVDVIARSTLTLHDDRFTMRSIVGRYLEHARVAAFRSGGELGSLGGERRLDAAQLRGAHRAHLPRARCRHCEAHRGPAAGADGGRRQRLRDAAGREPRASLGRRSQRATLGPLGVRQAVHRGGSSRLTACARARARAR